jgi:hypothetical protein
MKNLRSAIKWAFARYLVTDIYGTYQPCWTLREANSWLSVCAPGFACIGDLWSGDLITTRIQYIGEDLLLGETSL